MSNADDKTNDDPPSHFGFDDDPDGLGFGELENDGAGGTWSELPEENT
jgi:hypothetical protein